MRQAHISREKMAFKIGFHPILKAIFSLEI
jgi:hypothetical protein